MKKNSLYVDGSCPTTPCSKCCGGSNPSDPREGGKKGSKANTCTTPYANFDTCVKNSDTEGGGAAAGLERPNRLGGLACKSLPQPSLSCVAGASFQLYLPTRPSMGAHSWRLVFPWQTAISQSSANPGCFTSLFPCSPTQARAGSLTWAVTQVSAWAESRSTTGFVSVPFTYSKCEVPFIPIHTVCCERQHFFGCPSTCVKCVKNLQTSRWVVQIAADTATATTVCRLLFLFQ